VLITLLQSGVSLLSNSWLVYVGVLFITMVIFAPAGIMGLLMAHGPIVRAGQLGRLAVPYVRVVVPGILMVTGFVGLVELMSFLTIGAAQGKLLVLFGYKIDVHATLPWLMATLSLLVGMFWLRREARSFRRVWDGLMLELKPQRSIA
jgi:branched-chain amino acid transport system permease protein